MYLVLGLFLLFFIIVGIYAGKDFKDNKADSYFIADRQLNKWQIGISAGATANSGFIVVGAVGMGYSMGVSSLLYPLAWLLGDIIFWFLFAERIRLNKTVINSITIPQVLVNNSNNEKLRIVAGAVIFSLLLVYASAQFIASTKVISSFTDISSFQALLISFIFVLSYSIRGGFKSSVWTDVVQGIMMFILTISMIIWGIVEIGGINIFLSSVLSEGTIYTDLFGGRELWTLFIFILGFAFAGFGFSISQPQVTTRIFAANSPEEVKKSKWIYIGFLHFTWMGMCVIGIIAKILIPELADAETALPKLATTYFPSYIIGAVFAAMVATILSSVDSLLVSSASTLTIDFGLDDKTPKEKKLLLYRLSILFVGVLTLLMSLFMESTVFGAALFAATILAASIGSAMVLVILNLTNSSNTLLIAILVGLITAILWRVLGYHSIVSDGLVGFVVAMSVSIGYEKLILKKN
jgi:Na+/proline symporter